VLTVRKSVNAFVSVYTVHGSKRTQLSWIQIARCVCVCVCVCGECVCVVSVCVCVRVCVAGITEGAEGHTAHTRTLILYLPVMHEGTSNLFFPSFSFR
jgi:hypothetical protein